MTHFYEATTNGIEVAVQPCFLEQHSNPREKRYFWSYTVHIVNLREETVQLESRHWVITDANGRQQEVKGPGVLGEQPFLKPGGSYNYVSGCPLKTPSGIMMGAYTMISASGERFLATIPAFSLDSPYTKAAIN